VWLIVHGSWLLLVTQKKPMLSWQQQAAITANYSQPITPPSGSIDCQRRAWVEIDLTALAFNIRQLKQFLAPQTRLMAVVKADAYGHGAISVARVALKQGASSLAIATLGEGIELRQAGITAPILILGAINTVEEIREIAHWQLEPTLGSPQQALLFAENWQKLGKSKLVHLKIDTGMSRLGTKWTEALDFIDLVRQAPQLKIASIYSHFATADDPDPTIMELQHQRLRQVIEELKGKGLKVPAIHVANSAATLSDRSLHYDWVRIGLALYGLYPATHLSDRVKLKSVLQVKARVTQVKTIDPGTGVSYGYRFIADRELKIAVVGIGYADGVPRNLSNRLQAIINGKLVPQIGSITMDQLMLDVSTIPDLEPGAIVTLIGKEGDCIISADDWANTLGTISWEILCGFKHRLPRVNSY
jgi:alanine racemase